MSKIREKTNPEEPFPAVSVVCIQQKMGRIYFPVACAVRTQGHGKRPDVRMGRTLPETIERIGTQGADRGKEAGEKCGLRHRNSAEGGA